MNTSNRYGIETMARERQAEVEQQLRQVAEIRQSQPAQQKPRAKYRWIAIAATALSIVGTVASIIVAHAR